MAGLNPLFIRRCLRDAALALLVLAFPLAAQSLRTHDQPALLSNGETQAPLLVFTNGSGHVAPFHNGQMLIVGPEYEMLGIPHVGYVFAGWTPVTAFTIVDYSTDGSATTNTVLSPAFGSIKSRVLRFTVQPPEVIFDDPGVRTITMSLAWQANFVRANKSGEPEPER